jgi:hypothetical protein
MPAITIERLNAYAGPNIYGPAPGVRLRASADKDRSQRMRAALKDGAQFIGLMLAGLELAAAPAEGHTRLEAHFSTDEPELGAELCAYVVAGMNAQVAGDEEWDRDTPLLELQERRRHVGLGAPALRLVAEARRRGLPALRLPDGRLLLGQGAGGWAIDPARAEAPAPPWERLARIPVIAVSGVAGRADAVARWAAELAASGLAVRALDGASYEASANLLADPAAGAAVLGLDGADILRRGLAFERCDHAVITDLAGPRPAEAADDEEWLRAIGLPMLLAERPAQLNLADERLHLLIQHAPLGVLSYEC